MSSLTSLMNVLLSNLEDLELLKGETIILLFSSEIERLLMSLRLLQYDNPRYQKVLKDDFAEGL